MDDMKDNIPDMMRLAYKTHRAAEREFFIQVELKELKGPLTLDETKEIYIQEYIKQLNKLKEE